MDRTLVVTFAQMTLLNPHGLLQQMRAPEQIFTPRSHDVNHKMYIARPIHEDALKKAFRGSNHIVISGESGAGKSWLYKRVFEQMGVQVLTANMANVSRFDGLDRELQNLLDTLEVPVKVGYEEEKSAGINAVFASGQLLHKGAYKLGSKEPFERCLKYLREKAGANGKACLVFDNMERILENEALLRQVADAIILLDDGRYAGYGVKIALVGVPSDIKLYFLRTDNLQSVSNRLTEIPEVSRLSPQQGADLVLRGFRLLKMRCEPQRFEHDFSRQVPWLADYIPQHIQELCLQIAFAAEDENNVIDPRIFRVGISRWVHGSLIHQYSVIESNMNSRKTKSGRRNQALYALGQNDNEEFEASEVEEAVRKEFPESTKDGVKLNLPQILNDFTGSNHPLLRRSPKKTTYRFCDPRLRIVIRCILEKDGIGGVKKLDVRKLPKILPTTMNAD